jgi:hypothetical protein
MTTEQRLARLGRENRWVRRIGAVAVQRTTTVVLLCLALGSCNDRTERLEAEVAELRQRLSRADEAAAYWEEALMLYRRLYGVMDPHAPWGKVTRVEGDKVTISLGADEGLRVGEHCFIKRNQSVVALIRLIRVESSSSIGQTVPDSPRRPEVGDIVGFAFRGGMPSRPWRRGGERAEPR